MSKVILSLCDHSGVWCQPYRDAGYVVHQVDLERGTDIRKTQHLDSGVHGILAAPPCEAFAGSGAQYWPAKDEDGRTFEGLALIDACLRHVAIYNPEWWVLENPVGRLRRWIGPPKAYFHPWEYGDPYTKKTCLWGNFVMPMKTPVEPERACKQGSWVQKLGGKSKRTKQLRSVTPAGFAQAFFEANP